MKSKFDHNKINGMISELKVQKMCDEVAYVLERVPISDEVLLSDVTFSNGNIEAKIYFSRSSDLKQILGVLNPLPLATANGNVYPLMLAKKMFPNYEDVHLTIDRIDTDTIQCYTLIPDNELKPKYFVKCILQFIKR